MFIISRFIRIVRSQLNALLASAEDPAKSIEQIPLDENKPSEKMAAWIEEDLRLEREGKLKPYSKHLQAKMDSSAGTGGTCSSGEETPWERFLRKEAEERKS
ncbi:MAG: hypothetical protein HYS44_01015 [Candidatus Niyogibacteria bacterium]|nr:hypothetical protein [Candidatus Niyogibacteria bacterium]